MTDSDADIADRDELLQILTERARNGSVPAAKALLEELRRDASDDDEEPTGFDALDELAERRDRKAA